MNSGRIGFRKPRGFDRTGGGRRVPPPRGGSDRTILFVSLGLGLAALILVFVVFGTSSGSAPEGRDQSADLSLKEAMEEAQRVAGKGKLQDALDLLEAALRDPAHRSSKLLPQCRTLAEDYRKVIAFEKEAAEAIEEFDRKITASKADKTAMSRADAFWKECNDLISKYGRTAKAGILEGWRTDLERWRGTNAQDVWQKDYNYTRERIKTQFLDTENFSQAVKDWRRFAEPFNAPELKAKVESELHAIDELAKKAATKLVESAGTGALARQKLEGAMERFMETEGQKIITQKLKTLP